MNRLPSRITLALFLALSLGGGRAEAQTLTSTGSVAFPLVATTGSIQTVSANSSPTFTINVNGSFHIMASSGSLTSGGNTIPNTGFRYTATGGTVVKNSGQGSTPSETGTSGALSTAFKVLSRTAQQPSHTFIGTWNPLPANFELDIPGSVAAGSYTGTMTFTLNSGP